MAKYAKVEVVMNRAQVENPGKSVIQTNVVETFENVDVIDVDNNRASLELRRTTPNGLVQTLFHAQPAAWLSYKIVE